MTHVCLGLLRKSEQQTVLRSEQSGLGWNERERKGERDILRGRERYFESEREREREREKEAMFHD